MTAHQQLQLPGAGGKLRLTCDRADLRVTVEPAAGNTSWSSPLLDAEIINRMEERVETTRDFRIMRATQEDNALHVIVRDVARGITLGLWLSWVEKELSILMPPAEIEQARDSLYRLHSVMVLPELMSAQADGQMLIPVHTGMLASPAGKPQVKDRFLIYGEQERWELLPTLPVSGVQTPAGGVVCLARQGACDTWCAVKTDGHDNGTVAMGAMFRRQWIDPVDWDQRELCFSFLGPQDDLVHAAARRVRRHVIDDLDRPPLAERAAESPACAYQQRAYTMKIFHGIQRQGIMMVGRENRQDELLYQRVLTFKQAEACLRKLKAAGVDNVCLQSVGWNPKGHDGAWPTCFPIDRRLGGEQGFRSLIATAKELGYHITTHLNFGMSCFDSPDFDSDLAIQDIWGSPKVTGDWGGGIHSTHWGLALPSRRIEGTLEALKGLGFNGMQYLDFQGNPLYLNYHPTHGGPRADFAAGICRYQAAATRAFGAVQIEAGFLYCAPQADAVCAPYYNPFKLFKVNQPDWPIAQILDEQVPAWQLAMHGLVAQEQQGVDWKCAMTAVLFGKFMRDEWSADPGVMPVLDDTRIAQIKAIYDIVTVRFGHLLTQEITNWDRLEPGVEKTTFADGTEVLADFNSDQLIVNGETIERPSVL